MPDIEGPYIVTPTNPDDQEIADVMNALVNNVVKEYQQAFTGALMCELLYGFQPIQYLTLDEAKELWPDA